MTIAYPAPTAEKVYQPQHDSFLLVESMWRTNAIAGRRVLDLCTGSGFVAVAAAEMGCASVTAFDICPHAVRRSKSNAANAGVNVDVRQGSWELALDEDPYDVVLVNPPYVPCPPDASYAVAGPSRAWDAGPDGRQILDPLCAVASEMMDDGGSLLLVHSALAGAEESLSSLRATGLRAGIVARQSIPFGPVLTARAEWLEKTGRIERGCRQEEIIVIQADKR